MRSVLRRMLRWSDATPWHSWVIHAAAAVPLAFLLGAKATIAFFVLRELEQLAHATIARRFEPWYDYPLDAAIPALVSLLVTRL